MDNVGFSPQPLQVGDFSGGMTDFYIAGPTNKFQRADNLSITEDKQLKTRPGSEINDETNAFLPTYPRVSTLISFENEVLQYAKRYLYRNELNEIQGPTLNPAFSKNDGDSVLTYDRWNNHLLACNDSYSSPVKIFKNSSTFHVHNLGLPKVDYAGAIELANDLKSKFNSHIADASDHSIADSANEVLSTDASDFDSLLTLTTELLVKYDAHEGDAELGAGWAYHIAQEGSDHSVSVTTPTTLLGMVELLNTLKDKFNAHDADGTAHTTGSSYQSTEKVLPTGSGTADTKNYIYAIHFTYEYSIDDRTFREDGPVSYISVLNVKEPSVNSITLSGIPELINGSTQNWDVTNVKIEVYRTVNNGDSFYYVGVVDNGTNDFVDALSDATIQDNRNVYTDGGELDNDPAPECVALVQADNVVYYLGVREGNRVYTNKIRLAKPNQPYSAPESLYEELDDDIVGGASIGRFPIVFCRDKIYRLEGSYDSLGRGFVNKQQIENTVGCVSKASIVQTRLGIFFCHTSGFYHTDGYKVLKISEEIPESFKAIVDSSSKQSKISATFDSLSNRVLWTCQSDGASADNDTVFIAHVRFGIRPDTPFTRWVNINASSLLFFNNSIYRGTKDGYLLKHRSDLYVDPQINTALAASDFKTKTIIYDYRSCAYNFMTSYVRKWVSKIVVSADNITNLSLALFSNNDNSGILSELKPIQTLGNIAWGDPDILWGSSLLRWNYLPVIEEWRRFPAGGLRCSYKQVILTNLYADVVDSDDVSLATVDSIGKTATLPVGDSAWYSECENYYISFESDGYVNEYLITDRTDKVLTFNDDANNSTSTSDINWKIRGYKKNEVLSLIGYTIEYSMLTTTQNPYAGGSSE